MESILGRTHTSKIPVHPIQGQMLLFKTPENWLPTMCMNRVMYLIPRQDGHIVCGSAWLIVALAPQWMSKHSRIF